MERTSQTISTKEHVIEWDSEDTKVGQSDERVVQVVLKADAITRRTEAIVRAVWLGAPEATIAREIGQLKRAVVDLATASKL